MKLPWPAVLAGAALVVLGGTGLVRAAMPESAPAAAQTSSADPIVVSNAYVRPPAPPSKTAAAYFTVDNTTARADRLTAVDSGAGAESVLHTASMTVARDGLIVPAHGHLVLSTGHGHVMIEHLYGAIRPGQTVNLNLTFAHNGIVTVAAKVIALGVPAPTGG